MNVITTEEAQGVLLTFGIKDAADAEVEAILNSVGYTTNGDGSKRLHHPPEDPGSFFTKEDGFIPKRVGDKLKALAHMRVDAGRQLYRYHRGVYLPDGDLLVKAYTRGCWGSDTSPATGWRWSSGAEPSSRLSPVSPTPP